MATLPLPKKCARTLTSDDGGHTAGSSVNCIRFNKNAAYMVSCSSDRTLKLWNPHKGTMIKTYKGGHGFDVLDVAIAEDNSKLASVGGDRSVFLWDVATGKIIRKFSGHTTRVNCCCYNQESTLLLTGGYDTHVRIWDCRSNAYQSIQVLQHAKDSVTEIITHGSDIITASVDGVVRTYDVRQGILRSDIIGEAVAALALSNDAHCLLASCLDSTVRLLDRETGELLQDYEGHSNSVFRCSGAVTPDDAHVINGSEDGKIYVWDLVEGEVVATLTGHDKAVSATAACRRNQSTTIASSSYDGSIKVWE